MNVTNVPFGNKLQLKESGVTYIRANVSRDVLPRDENATVLINAATGKVRIVAKDRVVASHGTI